MSEEHTVELYRAAAKERDKLKSALERLVACPAISDGDLNSDTWGCPESAAAEDQARKALNI